MALLGFLIWNAFWDIVGLANEARTLVAHLPALGDDTLDVNAVRVVRANPEVLVTVCMLVR